MKHIQQAKRKQQEYDFNIEITFDRRIPLIVMEVVILLILLKMEKLIDGIEMNKNIKNSFVKIY